MVFPFVETRTLLPRPPHSPLSPSPLHFRKGASPPQPQAKFSCCPSTSCQPRAHLQMEDELRLPPLPPPLPLPFLLCSGKRLSPPCSYVTIGGCEWGASSSGSAYPSPASLPLPPTPFPPVEPISSPPSRLTDPEGPASAQVAVCEGGKENGAQLMDEFGKRCAMCNTCGPLTSWTGRNSLEVNNRNI
ncbi:WAS/WASL-interacting protein family member 1-like [Vombatus ursinus]|uniref:WAS/WASL-interacting protein family member 1-like n=1 Tax=Vombatus ursinus TaxID=29139 RepID=UPI000FFD454B|nr:WAS/WASL-interacting protein family member 1-like [Vombatus ursinus]